MFFITPAEKKIKTNKFEKTIHKKSSKSEYGRSKGPREGRLFEGGDFSRDQLYFEPKKSLIY